MGFRLFVLGMLLAKGAFAQYVESLDDFKTHMHAHVARVKILGVRLFETHPELFEGVKLEDLRRFLSLHDASKVNMNPHFLATYVTAEEPNRIIEELYRYYGVDLSATEGPLREEMGRLVKRLNDIDAGVQRKFFAKRGMLTPEGKPNSLAQKYLRIEKLADMVDRGENPVSEEEFRKVMRRASDFLYDAEDRRLARELERDYVSLTKESSYTALKARREEAFARSACMRQFRMLGR